MTAAPLPGVSRAAAAPWTGWTFIASQPGSGTITAMAGDRRVSIPVTVSALPLKTVENFEGTTSIFRGAGNGMDISLNHTADTVALGKGSLKIDYDLNTVNEFGSGDYTTEWRAASSTAVDGRLHRPEPLGLRRRLRQSALLPLHPGTQRAT